MRLPSLPRASQSRAAGLAMLVLPCIPVGCQSSSAPSPPGTGARRRRPPARATRRPYRARPSSRATQRPWPPQAASVIPIVDSREPASRTRARPSILWDVPRCSRSRANARTTPVARRSSATASPAPRAKAAPDPRGLARCEVSSLSPGGSTCGALRRAGPRPSPCVFVYCARSSVQSRNTVPS